MAARPDPTSLRPADDTRPAQAALAAQDAAAYADWFACLAEPTRVRLLHAVATSAGELPVGKLAERVGISQATCSHHVQKLADVGFVLLHKRGTTNFVSVNQACRTGLPHAADVVMGVLNPRPCRPADLPADVAVRAMGPGDWDDVRRIYAEGISTGNATFETQPPTRTELDAKWLPGHRWVATIDGVVVGWTAITPTSARDCYRGVGETSVYVDADHRGRGVGKTLVHRQISAADEAGIWTLQTSIFPENRASITLHHSAGYRTLGIRERIARHHGVWRDTVLLERRSPIAGI